MSNSEEDLERKVKELQEQMKKEIDKVNSMEEKLCEIGILKIEPIEEY